MTGITEAAKSRTPMIVLAAETGLRRCGRTSGSTRTGWPPVGAVAERVDSAGSAAADTARAFRTAGSSVGPWCSTCRWTSRRGRGRPAVGGARRSPTARRPTGASGCGRGRGSPRRTGRCSSPAGAPGARAAELANWPAEPARCWPPPRSPPGCSPARRSLGISGGFASPLGGRADPRRRPGGRLGLRAEHVDHAARRADRPGRSGGAGRPRRDPLWAPTGRWTWACSVTPGRRPRTCSRSCGRARHGRRLPHRRGSRAHRRSSRWRDVARPTTCPRRTSSTRAC